MAARPQDDNVIYANFGARTRVTSAEETGPQRRENTYRTSGAIRVFDAAVSRSDQGRVNRGRQYHQAGNVIDLDIRNGSVHGHVAGSQNDPFTVTIALPYRSADDLDQVAQELARTTNGMSRARRGQLSDSVLDTLLAADADDFRFICNCPDYVTVCKHVIAVADRLAEMLDADPPAVFRLRGMDLGRLEHAVMGQAQEVAKESQDEDSDLFWEGRPLPDLPDPQVAPALDDSDLDLLHKAMRMVSFTNVDQLRAVSDIEDLYDYLTR